MMSRVFLGGGLAACVLAVVAAPAPAHKAPGVSDKFIGSETAEPRFTGTGNQEFAFKPFTVSCEKAKSAKTGSTPTWPSETLFAEVKYSGCTATVTLHGMEERELKAKFLTPVDLNLAANGFVEAGAGGKPANGKLEGAGAIEIALSGAFKCTIAVEPGTFPAKAIKKPDEAYEAAKYKPEVKVEEGKKISVKDKLAITTALSKMAYELQDCEALSKTGGKGGYSGGLLAELPKGNLGWPLGQSSDFAIPTYQGEPYKVAVGPEGNLWFTEQVGRIGEINPFTHAISDFPTPAVEGFPAGIAVGADGNIWFTEYEASRIGEVNPVTRATSDFPTPTPESYPLGITAGPEGNLWFTESGKIGEINPVTHATSDFPTPTANGGASAITLGTEDDLWFTEYGQSRIGEINPVTHATSDFPTSTPESGPAEITTGPEGDIWFTEEKASRVGEINPVTHATHDFPTPTAKSEPEGLAAGPEGNIWFTEFLSSGIGEINPVTHATSDFPTPTAGGDPAGITAGPDGSIWFAELLGKIGEITTGAPPASIAPPAIVGGGQAGVPQVCEGAEWSNFASQQPLFDLFSFDGFQWLLNGSVITGQSTDSFTPSAGEEGDALSCTETVTYPVTDVTAVAASAAITVTS